MEGATATVKHTYVAMGLALPGYLAPYDGARGCWAPAGAAAALRATCHLPPTRRCVLPIPAARPTPP